MSWRWSVFTVFVASLHAIGIATDASAAQRSDLLRPGQSIACQSRGGWVVIGPGEEVEIGCRDDSLIINGRACEIDPFPNARISQLTLLRKTFARVPRVQSLLREHEAIRDDSLRWVLAVDQYSREVRGLYLGVKRSPLADSLLALSPLSVRPHSDEVLDLFASQPDDACELEVSHGGTARYFSLKGLAIPAYEMHGFCCARAESVAAVISAVIHSGRPFRAEVGTGLLFWSP